MRGVFVTGTDTGVGKTVIGAALAAELFQAGIDVQPRKPVETGCPVQADNLMPQDGLAYHQAVDRAIALDIITPYRFSAPLAPPRAAFLENQTILLAQLEQAVRRNLNPDSFCLVEGAGGFYSPVAEDGLNADLAQALGLPVLLVAADRLGCINHVLLTLQAIETKRLTCLAVVLNRTEEMPVTPGMRNSTTLGKLISVPVIELPFVRSMPVDVDALLKLIIAGSGVQFV